MQPPNYKGSEKSQENWSFFIPKKARIAEKMDFEYKYAHGWEQTAKPNPVVAIRSQRHPFSKCKTSNCDVKRKISIRENRWAKGMAWNWYSGCKKKSRMCLKTWENEVNPTISEGNLGLPCWVPQLHYDIFIFAQSLHISNRSR